MSNLKLPQKTVLDILTSTKSRKELVAEYGTSYTHIKRLRARKQRTSIGFSEPPYKAQARPDFPIGSQHCNSVLSDEQVAAIRQRLSLSKERGLQIELAREYGVTRQVIRRIKLGLAYHKSLKTVE